MKKMFILATLLIIIGGLMFTMTACASGWNLGKENVEKTTTVAQSFSNIDINTDTANISFVPSDDGTCKIVSYDIKKINYSANVENGILKIKEEDTRKWFARLFDMRKSTLTVYLPASEYGDLVISEDTGNIHIPENFKFKSINLNLSTGDTQLYASVTENVRIKGSTGNVTVKNITCTSIETSGSTGNVNISDVNVYEGVKVTVSTGDVSLNNINCKNLISEGDTGDIDLVNVNAGEKVSVQRSTGKVTVNNSNCGASLNITVSTGDVHVTNVKCTDLETEGSTGKLIMKNVIATGKFSIERSTGDVRFDGCDAAEIDVETDTGDVTGTLLSDKIFLYETDTGDVRLPESISGGRCKIETDTGDIKISIKQ